LDPALPEENLLACEALRVYADETLSIYYAPFDQVNENARVVLMGITPGRQQMWQACLAARGAIANGASDDEVLRIAKNAGSFAGPMRANLVRMLDEIGVAKHLGIDTAASLFSAHAKLLFSTSAVSFPVFIRGQNYSGHTPRLLMHPILRRIIEQVWLRRVALVPKALVIPLGKAVSDVVEHFAEEGAIDVRRCLLGFPHPSGGNGHRVRLFSANREALRNQVDKWFRSGV
jgi:hypothetical protein